MKVVRKKFWQFLAILLLISSTSQLFITGSSIVAASPTVTAPSSRKELSPVAVLPPTQSEVERAAAAICLPITNFVYLPLVGSATGGVVVPPEPMLRELQYGVGKTYVYQYQMTTDVVAGKLDSAGYREDSPNTSVVRGTVRVSITGKEGADVFVGYISFVDPVVCADNGEEPDSFMDDADFLGDLQTAVGFKQRADGVILEVSSSPTAQPAAVNLLKGILNSLQATLQADDSYTASESAAQGTYTAHYAAEQLHTGLQLTKTIDQDAFANFLTQGDLPSFMLNNTIRMTLDRATGVFSYIKFHEVIRSEDVQALDPDTVEGVAVWNTSRTSGFLKLVQVEDTPAQALSALDLSAYQSGGLGIEFDAPVEPPLGIDMDTLDLAAELDALEADPANLDLFHRMTLILSADATGSALTEMQSRLLHSLDQEEVARIYIDLLGYEGSAGSQAVLAGLLDPTDPQTAVISTTLQEQALINLALVKEPAPVALGMMTTLMDSSVVTTHADMATLAWGAMASTLSSSHPLSATEVYADLRTRLNNASTDEHVELLLTALGNTANSGLPGIVSAYFTHPSPRVQWTAYQALQGVPGQEVENILIAALEDATISPFVKQGAVLALKNLQGGVSPVGSKAVKDFLDKYPTPQGGIFQKTWTKEFGGQRVGGSAPGHVLMASPPFVSRLELQTMQEVNFYLKAVHFNFEIEKKLLTAQAWSKPKDASFQQFGVRLIIFGKTLKDEVQDLGCAASKTENIYNATRDIYNANFQYPVWGALVVGVGLKIDGNFKMDYHYNWSMCNPLDMTGQLGITPQASLRGTASGYAALWRLRGGVAMETDILAVKIPPTLTATYSLANDFKACALVPLQISALNGSLVAFAEVKAFGKWNRFLEKTLWSFALPSGNYKLVEQCWTP